MSDLRTLLREMRAVQRELGQAVVDARLDPAKRMTVIDLRKQSNEAVFKVSTQMQIDPLFQADPALGTEFRHRFSEIRSKVAIFQAKWPAVLLDKKDPDFDRSASELRACNREFDEWIGKMFDV